MRYCVSFAVGLGLVLTACGSAAPAAQTTPPPMPEGPHVRPGVAPPGDEAGFRALLSGEVTNGGLWFTDAACRSQFGTPGRIAADALDAFARCVATLQLRPSGRAHWLDDASVLTDASGFEIESHVASGRLDFIGFSARAPGMPDLPTITPEALEALRVSGDPKATISDDDAKRIAPAVHGEPTLTEHLRLCINEAGELITVMPGTTTKPASAAAFSAVVRAWKFRPFVVGDKPVAVCSILALHHPATAAAADRLPRPPQLSKAGHLVYTVAPTQLEPLRITGTKLVTPDDEDKIHLFNKRLIGSFKLCLDETGRYEEGELLKSTGLPRYDAKIARTMMDWTYRPYLVDGKPVPVCSAVTFIYTQH